MHSGRLLQRFTVSEDYFNEAEKPTSPRPRHRKRPRPLREAEISLLKQQLRAIKRTIKTWRKKFAALEKSALKYTKKAAKREKLAFQRAQCELAFAWRRSLLALRTLCAAREMSTRRLRNELENMELRISTLLDVQASLAYAQLHGSGFSGPSVSLGVDTEGEFRRLSRFSLSSCVRARSRDTTAEEQVWDTCRKQLTQAQVNVKELESLSTRQRVERLLTLASAFYESRPVYQVCTRAEEELFAVLFDTRRKHGKLLRSQLRSFRAKDNELILPSEIREFLSFADEFASALAPRRSLKGLLALLVRRLLLRQLASAGVVAHGRAAEGRFLRFENNEAVLRRQLEWMSLLSEKEIGIDDEFRSCDLSSEGFADLSIDRSINSATGGSDGGGINSNDSFDTVLDVGDGDGDGDGDDSAMTRMSLAARVNESFYEHDATVNLNETLNDTLNDTVSEHIAVLGHDTVADTQSDIVDYHRDHHRDHSVISDTVVDPGLSVSRNIRLSAHLSPLVVASHHVDSDIDDVDFSLSFSRSPDVLRRHTQTGGVASPLLEPIEVSTATSSSQSTRTFSSQTSKGSQLSLQLSQQREQRIHSLPGEKPYARAIELLARLCDLYEPSAILCCLKDAVELMHELAQQYRRCRRPDDTACHNEAIGADIFFPIFLFCTVQAKLYRLPRVVWALTNLRTRSRSRGTSESEYYAALLESVFAHLMCAKKDEYPSCSAEASANTSDCDHERARAPEGDPGPATS
ncbi:MAG: hypothetical protein MHM6MM_002450 [Cercozoa sp. M6MM]